MRMGGKGAAALFSVLIVVSTFAPFVAVAGAQSNVAGNQTTVTPAGDQPTATPVDEPTNATATPSETKEQTSRTDREEVPENLWDAPPAVKKYYASQQIASLDAGGHSGHAKQINRSHDLINGTQPYYRGVVRLNDSAAFTDDAQGVRALAHLHGTNQSDEAKQMAKLVFEADNESARTAVQDARRALDRYGDEMDQGQRQAAESQLAVAERALDRADREASRTTDGRKYYQQRGKSITQLRTAHRHANKVLRFVDRETSPDVSITTTADPVHNGNDTVQYVVTGNVSDPRPWTVENVSVTVNGDRTVTAQTATDSTAPARNASYRATVNLTQRINVIEVTVTDGDNEQTKRGNEYDEQDESETKEKQKGKDKAKQNGKAKGKKETDKEKQKKGNNGKQKGDPKERGRESSDDEPTDSGSPLSPQQSTVILRLDGDGLPQAFERNVTKTDPLDYDSNSAATATNEADNGTIDGHEDFDGDRLTTLEERKLGTEAMVADTDGDGLDDGDEIGLTQTDPLATDTDGDGTADAREDPDGDTLTNLEEIDHGTDPLYADIDGDGLNDAEELELGTDPLTADTDEDFLRDGAELQDPFNTDPLDSDTDDDGILDGNETYTTETKNESTGVTVSTTGEGNLGSEVGIKPTPKFHNGTNASAGPTVRVDGVEGSSEANVTIPIPESERASENLTVFVRTFEGDSVWKPVETTINGDNESATATVSSTGFVTVLNGTAWHESLRTDFGDGNATTSFDTSCGSECDDSGDSLVIGTDTDGTSSSTSIASPTFESTQSVNSGDASGGYTSTNQRLFAVESPTGLDAQAALFKGTTASMAPPPAKIDVGRVYNTHDQDGDTVPRWQDDCPGDPNQTPDGCPPDDGDDGDDGGDGPTDSDGDGIPDDEETAQGTDPNDADTDGDGVDDDDDNCPSQEGSKDNGCPVSGSGSVKLFIGDVETADLKLWYAAESQGFQSDLELTVDGDSGSETRQLGTTNGYTTSTSLDLSAYAGETVTLSFESTGVHAEIERARLRTDSDGDGLFDRFELDSHLNPATGNRFTTDVHEQDTDGDGLDDDEEISTTFRNDEQVVVGAVADPSRADSDGDSLGDNEELAGCTVSVEKQGGDLIRWDPTGTTETFNSSPTVVDSDADGLPDDIECTETYTDPESRVTYEITEDHQTFVDNLDLSNDVQTARAIRLIAEGQSLSSVSLTDGSDSFDFVFDDSASRTSNPVNQVTFTALDNETRSDRWLSNHAEVHVETDPWDPDSDDDGLTDGQEHHGLTIKQAGSLNEDPDLQYDFDATNPDTDGDGYWDGWIGVYGVENTDNVILYREHLQSGGITGNDIVNEQVDFHPANVNDSTASGTSTTLPDSGTTQYHSNIHVGELHWETDPVSDTGDDDTPSPSITIEVDYHNWTHATLRDAEWRNRIQSNYALYGIDVQFDTDSTDVVTQDDLTDVGGGFLSSGRDARSPFEIADLNNISDSDTFHQSDHIYMMVGPRGGGSINSSQTGLRLRSGDRKHTYWLAVFAGPTDETDVASRFNTNEAENMSILTAKTAVHEIGHHLRIGDADDDCCWSETYSGSGSDPTPENIHSNRMIGTPERWSVMASGHPRDMFVSPTGTKYTAFSIEELFTVTTNSTQK